MIGSDDGQIRMYSERSLTRANTAIPGLGGPITAVDVTYDGKWVLATTKNYLMVVKTTFKVAYYSVSWSCRTASNAWHGIKDVLNCTSGRSTCNQMHGQLLAQQYCLALVSFQALAQQDTTHDRMMFLGTT